VSEIRERPIIFSGPMVQAILEDRKTQTRRIIKPQPSDYPALARTPPPSGREPKKPRAYFDAYNGGPNWCWWDEWDRQGADWIRCPYGAPGDRLRVKETWCYEYEDDSPAEPERFLYEADGQEVIPGGLRWRKDGTMASPWQSSRFMPKRAARLFLEILSVRVKRLQDISEADAKAEGASVAQWWTEVPGRAGPLMSADCYRAGFAGLWDRINGKRLAWEANPYVWALEFRRLQSHLPASDSSIARE
jgi:hypothetical protein